MQSQEKKMTRNETQMKSIKSLYVRPKQNSKLFYYPKSIPRERGTCATCICIIIISLLLLVDLVVSGNEKGVLFAYSFSFILLFILQFLQRVILIVEEIRHITSRYEGNYLTLLKYAFYFSTSVMIGLVLTSFLCIFIYLTTGKTFTDFILVPWRVISLVTFSYLLGITLHIENCSLNDCLWVAANNGLDYGSGMAYSFFYGYLNLVLPNTGTESKNLEELMKDYEDSNRIRFAVYKLFILLPRSLKCFVSLQNEFCPTVDESSSLPEKIITVAGVKDRVYKNAVYKIRDKKNNKKVYVAAEYATPLKTFRDVFDKRGDHSVFYEKYKKEIILQFYLTLKNILKTKGLSEHCELIYYEDSYKDGDRTVYYDVGEILLDRIKEIKKYEKRKTE